MPWSTYVSSFGKDFANAGGITSAALFCSTTLFGMLDKQINQPQSNPQEWIYVSCLYCEDWETEAHRDLSGFKRNKRGAKKKIITEQASHRERGLNANLPGASHQPEQLLSAGWGSLLLSQLQSTTGPQAEHRVQPLQLLARWAESWASGQRTLGQGHTDGQDRRTEELNSSSAQAGRGKRGGKKTRFC